MCWFRPTTVSPMRQLIRPTIRAVRSMAIMLQPVSAGPRLIPITGNFSLRPHPAYLSQATGQPVGMWLVFREHLEASATSRQSRWTPRGTFGKRGSVVEELFLLTPPIAVRVGIHQFK